MPDLATVSVTVMTCSFSQVLPADWMKGNPSQTCGLLFYIFYIDFSENLNVAASITRFHQDLATIENLASDILDSVAASLKHRRPSQLLWKRLAFMTEILLQWFFPPTYKSFRTCPALESLLGCLFAARSLIWLRTRWWTPQARNILRFFAPLLQLAISHGFQNSPLREEAFCHLVNMQKLLINGFSAINGGFGLYQWWTDSTRYTGIGQLQRPRFPCQGGLSRRLFEHLFATIRPASQDGRKLRYRLARRVAPGASFFLIVAIGTEPRIRALEKFDIHAHRPKSNGFKGNSATVGRPTSKRSRPPKLQREKGYGFTDKTRTLAILDNYEALQYENGTTTCGQLHFNPWDFNFAAAYALTQQRLHGLEGFHGPLNILEPAFRPLFVLYIARGKSSFQWILADSHDPDAVLHCGLLLSKLRTAHQRTTASKVLDPWLRYHGFMGTSRIHITVKHTSFVTLAKNRIRSNAARLAQGHQLYKRWILSRFRVFVGKAPLFSDKWNHAKLAKACSVENVPAPSDLGALPMKRIEKNWRVEERIPANAEVSACLEQVDNSFKAFDIHGKVKNTAPIPFGMKRRWASQADTQVKYENYTSAFKDHGFSTPALIPDDKCKKFAWAMAHNTYITLLLSFTLAAATWSLTSLSLHEANQWIVCMLIRILGKPLARRLRVSKNSFLLPYTYVTIKAKCWAHGVKICKRENHSCVRKIISYCHWKGRRLWRTIHRAWETILKHHGNTCDVWCLSHGSKLLGSIHSLPTSCRTCCRCRRDMNDFEGITGDAGQFFEVVDAGKAVAEANELLTLFAQKSPSHFVTVLHTSQKRRAWFSKSANKFSQKTTTWSMAELFRAFLGAMLVCLTSVGNRVMMLQCLPIGGLMSKVAASVVLGGEERRWKQSVERQQFEGFRHSMDWDHTVLHLRYVDDIILISRIYCCRCLQHAVQCIYSVSFDCSLPHDRTLSWLDLKIYLDSGQLGLNIKPLYPTPPWHSNLVSLKCLFLGRFRRWAEISTAEEEWKKALFRLLVDVQNAQWQFSKVLYVLHSIYSPVYKQFVIFGITAWKQMRGRAQAFAVAQDHP